MQISSGDVDKQRQSRGIRSAEEGERGGGIKGTMGNVLYVSEMHKYTKKIPVSLMGFFFVAGKSCITL